MPVLMVPVVWGRTDVAWSVNGSSLLPEIPISFISATDRTLGPGVGAGDGAASVIVSAATMIACACIAVISAMISGCTRGSMGDELLEADW